MRVFYQPVRTDEKSWRQIPAECLKIFILLWHGHCDLKICRYELDGLGDALMANANEVDYPPEATLGDQRLRLAGGKFRIERAEASLSRAAQHREIAQLAYELYLRRGKLNGRDLEDWLTAEAIVHSSWAPRKETLGDDNDGEETE